MGNQIVADRIMDSGHEGDFEFGADSIAARDQQRFAISFLLQPEQGAETADIGQHSGRECRASQGANPLLGLGRGVDIHAGTGIRHFQRIVFFHESGAKRYEVDVGLFASSLPNSSFCRSSWATSVG